MQSKVLPNFSKQVKNIKKLNKSIKLEKKRNIVNRVGINTNMNMYTETRQENVWM